MSQESADFPAISAMFWFCKACHITHAIFCYVAGSIFNLLYIVGCSECKVWGKLPVFVRVNLILAIIAWASPAIASCRIIAVLRAKPPPEQLQLPAQKKQLKGQARDGEVEGTRKVGHHRHHRYTETQKRTKVISKVPIVNPWEKTIILAKPWFSLTKPATHFGRQVISRGTADAESPMLHLQSMVDAAHQGANRLNSQDLWNDC